MADLGPAVRVAAGGLAALGLLAAGAAVGAAAERVVVRRRLRGEEGERYGSLQGTVHRVATGDGTVLHVEVDEAPDAPDDLTVVFCHGFALSQHSWHYQRRDLRGLARLVLWDHRSHGHSGRATAGSHDIDTLGHDLSAILDTLVPDGPIVLIGHSMGGMTVMALAAHRPDLFGERVRGVALVATTAGDLPGVSLGLPRPVARLLHRVGPTAASVAARRPALVELGRDSGSDLALLLTRLYSFGSAVPPDMTQFVAAMIAATPVDVLADFLPGLEAHDKAQALAALQHTEVLVMVGETDRLTPVEHSRAIVARVPGARLVVLPETGHMITLERHERVTAELRELIASVRRHLPPAGAP